MRENFRRHLSFIVAAGLLGAPAIALAQDDTGMGMGSGTETTPTPEPTPEPAASSGGGYGGLHSGFEGIVIPLFSNDFSSLVTALQAVAGGGAAGNTAVPTADFIWGLNATAAVDVAVGVILDHDPGDPNAMPATTSSTRFGVAVGAGYRMYKTMKGKIRPYLEPGLHLAIPDFGNAGSTIAVGAFGQFGVELLVTDQLTLGTHVGATVDFTQKFKKDVIATETGTVDIGFWW